MNGTVTLCDIHISLSACGVLIIILFTRGSTRTKCNRHYLTYTSCVTKLCVFKFRFSLLYNIISVFLSGPLFIGPLQQGKMTVCRCCWSWEWSPTLEILMRIRHSHTPCTAVILHASNSSPLKTGLLESKKHIF